MVLIVPIVLVGAVAVATASTATADAIARLGVWTLGGLAFVGVLAMVGVAICMIARSPQAAMATLVLVWVAAALAALPGATALAERLTPMPSFQEMKLVVREEAPAYWTPESGAQQIDTILKRYGADNETALQINLRGAQLDLAERHAQQVFDREIGGFFDRVEAQDRTHARLGWLSPAVAFSVVSAAAAGTDFASHRHFVDAAEHYRRDLVNRMNADLIPNPAVNGRLHTNDNTLWSQVPEFDYRQPPLADAIRPARAAVVALLGWIAIGMLLLAVTARTLRP
jgi:ABC-2 type transport system permease protein